MVKARNLFLRKHRRWPFSSCITKWHQAFTQILAMQSFKHLVGVTLHPHNKTPQLQPQPICVSSLLRPFSLYNLLPTPQAYHFLIQTLQFNHIPSVLHHLECVEKFQTPEYVLVHLIQIYGNANRIQDAVDVFLRIPKFRCVPSVQSLNALLAILCRNQYCIKLVPQILLKSLHMNIRIEESTLLILVRGLCKMNKVGYATEILLFMIQDGFCVDHKVCSFILSSICAKWDLDGDELMGFWRKLRNLGFSPDMCDYNSMIRFLVKKGRVLDAWDVLNQMRLDRIKPGIAAYTMVLNGVIAQGEFTLADELFDELLMLGLVPDVYTYNTYIASLCKQNKLEEGIKMVACMEELRCKPNVLTYNMLFEAICKVGDITRLRDLVREMRYKGIEMNLVSYVVVIDGLLIKGEILEAVGLVEEVLHKHFCHQTLAFDKVICCLCQRGLVNEALALLRKMFDKNVSPGSRAWEALLSCESKLNFAKTTLTDLVNPL